MAPRPLHPGTLVPRPIRQSGSSPSPLLEVRTPIAIAIWEKLRFQASTVAQIIQLLAEVLWASFVTELHQNGFVFFFFVDSFVLKELPTVFAGASKLMYPKWIQKNAWNCRCSADLKVVKENPYKSDPQPQPRHPNHLFNPKILLCFHQIVLFHPRPRSYSPSLSWWSCHRGWENRFVFKKIGNHITLEEKISLKIQGVKIPQEKMCFL